MKASTRAQFEALYPSKPVMRINLWMVGAFVVSLGIDVLVIWALIKAFSR